MFMSIVSHILSAWFAFLLPCYSTFKALSHLPASEQELQRWAMYWSVIGAFVAFEYVAEWLISWLPFYWETKTLLLLFLALPQTQGSTWVYTTYLQPFFSTNEVDLDSAIVSAQQNVLTFIQTRLAGLWEIILGLLNKLPATGPQPPATENGRPAPASNPFSLDSAMGMWRTYGPSILSALQPKSASAATVPSRPVYTPNASASSFQTNTAARRAPATFDNEDQLPNPYAAVHDSSSHLPPPFPEPQLS